MRYEIEAGDDVYCSYCEAIRTAVVVDFGYGPTEFWGSCSNHVDLQTVCNRCESSEIIHADEVEEEEEEEAEA